MISDWYDLDQPQHLSMALEELRGYWKLWSACLLKSVSLPTPRGIILCRINSVQRRLQEFLGRNDVTTALIRHDRQNEAPPYQRGGFLVPQERLLTTVRSFLSEGRIVAVYEPFNRLENGYNLNLLFQSIDEVLIEIAGPGFDASNLQRGDITPHEVLNVELSGSGSIRAIAVVRRTTNEEYRRSVRTRIDKFQEFSSTWQNQSKDQSLCSSLLQTQEYRPVPRSLLIESITAIVESRFIQRFDELTGVGLPLNISTSYVNRGKRQVFWDATGPSLKFQGLS